MIYEILDGETVTNTIMADAEFMQANYPQGNYREVAEPPAPTPPEPRRLTKRAFQDRFPLTANGVSRKYDLMDLFMRDDGYAAALGVSGAALYELRALIVTGLNRLNASAYVDLDLADAANFTGLLLQPSIPEAFRLTLAEREAMLNTPLAAGERYTG